MSAPPHPCPTCEQQDLAWEAEANLWRCPGPECGYSAAPAAPAAPTAPQKISAFSSLFDQYPVSVAVWSVGFVVEFVRGLAELVQLNTPYTFEVVDLIGVPVALLANAVLAALWPFAALGWFLGLR